MSSEPKSIAVFLISLIQEVRVQFFCHLHKTFSFGNTKYGWETFLWKKRESSNVHYPEIGMRPHYDDFDANFKRDFTNII